MHGESLKDFCKSCGSGGKAVPAGTYTGPITATITTTLHVTGKVPSEGGGSQTAKGTVTVVSDGTKVTGTIHVSGGGTAHVGVPSVLEMTDASIGQMDGTISGTAVDPIASGTLKGTDEAAGAVSSPFRAGLHLTKVTCSSITGDLVAMFAEITRPEAQYVTIGGQRRWTATKQ